VTDDDDDDYDDDDDDDDDIKLIQQGMVGLTTMQNTRIALILSLDKL
jgi:hypothetical protein